MLDYDVIVIGAGSGGMAAAKRAASYGASVAVIENRTVGGTCVARGCMPKKFLVIASEKIRDVQSDGPRGFGSSVTDLEWNELIDHEQGVVSDLIDINRDGLVSYEGVEVIEGTARLEGAGRVRVDGEVIECEKLVLAMGQQPSRPSIPGAEHALTSDEFLRYPEKPDSMAVVGGGYISVEFACVLNAFGVEVEVFQRPDYLIKDHDRDVSSALKEAMQDQGIQVHTSCEVDRIRPMDSGQEQYRLHYTKNGGEGVAEAEKVLMAAGRTPNTEGMGLSDVGVERENGYIRVNEHFETSVSGVYAVGDVNGIMEFTPVAIAEGKVAAANAVREERGTLNREAIPHAVFSHPPIGSSGLTERAARERYSEVEVGTKEFTPFSATVKGQSETTFMKVIYGGEEKRLVGLHVMGPHGPEMVQGFALAIRTGARQEHLADFPGIHPTVAEEIFSTKPDG